MNQGLTCEVCGFASRSSHGLVIHRMRMHGLFELTCRQCGVELTDANWLPYLQKLHHRVCARCWKEVEKVRQHRRNVSDKGRLRLRRYNQRVKLKALSHYSPSLHCQCSLTNCWHGNQPCPVSDIRVLQIDHINGGGTKHIRSIKREKYGRSFHRWLIAQGFPRGYQVLCSNCNWVKAEVKGERLARANPLATGTGMTGT